MMVLFLKDYLDDVFHKEALKLVIIIPVNLRGREMLVMVCFV
jgi:hypothetical protein